MIEYRTYLTGLVAVFLALGLGMLVGSALVGSPSSERQQRDLRTLQQNFAEFSQKYTDLRTESENVKGRLHREDQAMRDLIPSFVGRRLVGRRIAIVLFGELDDTAFVGQVGDTIEMAGGKVASTTRIGDDWLPVEEVARAGVARAMGVAQNQATDASMTSAVGHAIGLGREAPLRLASELATSLRLDGDYSRSVDCVLLISGTRTPSRHDAARVHLTPEYALSTGLSDTPARIIAAEPDGDETLSTIPYVSRSVSATVDNIDMASGQLSAVYALAGRDGRFGIKRSAERAIPAISE
ncbi:MAG TPA: copper transporter [Armatimonadota bacterium]|jgi:hypothetical protein